MTQSRTKSGQVYVGSAAEDAPGNRGWLLGHFLPEDDPRHSDDVEIKWGIHPAADEREQWVADDHRTAAILLISGRFRIELPDRSVVLARQGDYVVFHATGHSWRAEEESLVVTVRWPSVPGYAVPASAPGPSAWPPKPGSTSRRP
jgi:hypothetical protein